MYEDANYTNRREDVYESSAGANAVSAKFAAFQKLRIKAVHAVVTVAGTSTAHAINVVSGTNTLATLALGTTAIGGTVSVKNVNFDLNPLTMVAGTNAADATGKALVVYEYHMSHDGTKSP